MKVRSRGLFRTKLELPIVLLSCSVFFLAGFFGSILLSQFQDINGDVPRSRILESVIEEKEDQVFEAIPNGHTGDSFVSSIPFQVLSWKPRAVYYPGFASAEQCDHIIKKAKANLRPSGLAFRNGETAETTKGVRTSSGTFISASGDSSGTLAQIEEKIARAKCFRGAMGRHSMFCVMRLVRDIYLIMMHSTQLIMDRKGAKGNVIANGENEKREVNFYHHFLLSSVAVTKWFPSVFVVFNG